MNEDLIKKLLFLERNPRHKALFLLLLRNDDYINSDTLSKKLEVSSRTIKSDINVIAENLYGTPIKINSIRSKGTKIEFANQDLKNDIKDHFKIFTINNLDNDVNKRALYILKRLLISENPIRIETLQDELFLNTTNYIKKEMETIKKILVNYSLSIRSIPKKGLVIVGNEFNRLLCLLKVNRYFNETIDPEYRIENYSKLFTPKFSDKRTIKKIVCKCIMNTRIVFSDIYLERFIMLIILLSNKEIDDSFISNEIKTMDFDYKITDEYKLIKEIDQVFADEFHDYKAGNKITIQLLTYVAIMSTDLYRTSDCCKEKYGSLIDLSTEIRYMIIQEFENIFKVIDIATDVVLLKDLMKILIPISMKIKLGITDDVDLGFYNQQYNKPIITYFIEQVSLKIKEKYNYEFSLREKNLILSVIYEYINGIELIHKKLNIALIAIDGRISTQQLKFCLRKNYSNYVNKIDTKVLYEFEQQDKHNYDCYFCLDFGKNMNIPYKPIFFFKEGLTDDEYNKSLQPILLNAYDYGSLIPSIEYIKIDNRFRINDFPIKKYLNKNDDYINLLIGERQNINLNICFNGSEEFIKIFYFEDDDIDINGIRYYIIININVNYSSQKLKVILSLITNLLDKPDRIRKYLNDSKYHFNEML